MSESAGDLQVRVSELESAVKAAEQRVEAIQAIAAAVGSTLDLSDVLSVILDRITVLLSAERSSLYLLNDSRDTLVSMIAQGTPDATEIRLAVGEGIAGWVARTGRTLNIKDAYDDPRFDPRWDDQLGFRTRSILCVPMRNLQRRILGVLQVLNKQDGYFSIPDEQLLQALAGQAAVTLENAKLFSAAVGRNVELLETQARLEHKIRELDALFEVEQVMSGSTSLEAMLDRVLRKVTEVLDAEAGSVALRPVDGSTDPRLTFHAAVGPVAHQVLNVRLEPGEGIIGWVSSHGESLRVDDVGSDARHSTRIADELGFPVKSELAAPLRQGPEVIGAIGVLNKQGAASFTDDDLKVLRMVAGQIARAIQLHREREQQQNEDRLATVGRMLSSVVHDLKAPMTIISGYVQLMARREDGEERARYARQVLDQFANMDAMTREVLAFARGESELLVRKVHMSRFIEDLAESLERQVEDRPIEVSVVNDGVTSAWFDETKILRVVHNLCRNAMEAMPEGGELGVRFAEDGGTVVVSVSDTGQGIPEEIEDKLFESFVTTGKKDGTGLGLAIVQKIVQDHGGTVTFRSDSSRGTTFDVRIPPQR